MTLPSVDDTSPTAPLRCAVASLLRSDRMVGTAVPAVRYLLVEDPGPWGPDPHPTGSLPPAAAQHLEAQARTLSARLLLIRRPGRVTPADLRRWAIADVDAGSIAWGSAASADSLADVDVVRDAEESESPTYLVCTHGRHDRCCAVEGRPVAAALAAHAPEDTWECSHVGGDRFAANVVILASGLVYGRVTTADVGELIEAQRHDVIVPRLLRGRSGLAPAAQVAEAHVRTAWDDNAIGAVTVDLVSHLGRGVWAVRGHHSADGRRFDATLSETHEQVPTGLTCAGRGPSNVRSWRLDRLDA